MNSTVIKSYPTAKGYLDSVANSRIHHKPRLANISIIPLTALTMKGAREQLEQTSYLGQLAITIEKLLSGQTNAL